MKAKERLEWDEDGEELMLLGPAGKDT